MKDSASFQNHCSGKRLCGPEAYEELVEEMGSERDLINSFIDEEGGEKEISVEDESGVRTYKVSIALVLDMKALCSIMGLYSCYNHGTKWGCPWCLVTSEKIGDFTHEKWDFRDIDQMVKAGKELEVQGVHTKTESIRERIRWDCVEKRSMIKSSHLAIENSCSSCGSSVRHPRYTAYIYGHHSPSHEDPDPLGCSLRNAQDREEVSEQLIECLEGHRMDLKIYKPKDSEKGMTFSERLKKSRFNRVLYLKILSNYKLLLDWRVSRQLAAQLPL
ncbi:hypothetical protein PROFUN_09968 [Planoprotostelium fungivorum]|uniref:Uncharacterized protein n=1 Tax=Planoprotostelium fungivorum TaxID=1890364 RepID=A0A2P6NFG0_9EUKA|nr:hypothetical protein PROFUN_09968 [Planoprotostelium fungivorum]